MIGSPMARKRRATGFLVRVFGLVVFASVQVVALRPFPAGAASSTGTGTATLAGAQKHYDAKDYRAAGTALLAIRKSRKLTAGEARLLSMCYYRLGRDELETENWKQAWSMLDAALKWDPKNARANYSMGRLWESRKYYESAVAYYRRTAELDVEIGESGRGRIKGIGERLLNEIDADLEDGDFSGAANKFNFVRQRCGNLVKEMLDSKSRQLGGEFAAAEIYVKAEEYYARNRSDRGNVLLTRITKDFPNTRVAEHARRVLLGGGRKVFLGRTATGYRLSDKWKRMESEHFVIYYQKVGSQESFKKLGEAAIVDIMNDLRLKKYPLSKKKIKMYLFADKDSWQKFIWTNSNRTTKWSGGFALPQYAEIYLYTTDRRRILKKRVIPHELTHIIHRNAINVWKYQPLWLVEGVARGQEENGVRDARNMMKKAGKKDVIPLSWLAGGIDIRTSSPRVVMIFYAESAILVDVIKRKFGRDKLLALMKAFAERTIMPGDEYTALAEVVRETLGIEAAELEKMWLHEMGK